MLGISASMCMTTWCGVSTAREIVRLRFAERVLREFNLRRQVTILMFDAMGTIKTTMVQKTYRNTCFLTSNAVTFKAVAG
jgi:hypothetical protein